MALVARRATELDAVASEIGHNGGFSVAIATDVTDVAATRAAVERAARELGSLDMVIANAGRGDTHHASTLTWEEVAPTFDINLRGAIATLTAAIPIMMAQQSGHLVSVSSLAGRRGLPTAAAYGASKAALSNFAESLRIDLFRAGIRVTDVQPGFVETPMTLKQKASQPFRWKVDKAARVIADRLERAPGVIAFPWQLALITRLTRLLPDSAYDAIMRGALK